MILNSEHKDFSVNNNNIRGKRNSNFITIENIFKRYHQFYTYTSEKEILIKAFLKYVYRRIHEGERVHLYRFGSLAIRGRILSITVDGKKMPGYYYNRKRELCYNHETNGVTFRYYWQKPTGMKSRTYISFRAFRNGIIKKLVKEGFRYPLKS